MLHKVVSIALVVALVAGAAPPALASQGSWAGWVQQLLGWLNRVAEVVERIRSAVSHPVGVIWDFLASSGEWALGKAEYAVQAIEDLLSMAGRVPGSLAGWITALRDRILGQASREPPEGSPEANYRLATSMSPALQQMDRASTERQVQALRLVASSEAISGASEEVARDVQSSSVAADVAASSVESAERLRLSVQDAQSSRALLQYLGEGISDLMAQQGTLSAEISRTLSALAQQQALTNRELQLVVAALAQRLVNEEREKKAKVVGTQEALRAVSQGYSTSLAAVGEAVLDLRNSVGERRKVVEDAITPRSR
jgi:hypothetical protein